MVWWDVVKFTVEVCFLIFHTSVLYCVIKEKRTKNAQFSSPFFTFYILESLFDIVFVLSYVLAHWLVDFGGFMPFVTILLALCSYGQLGLGIVHALISANRYTAIALPLQNKQIWIRNRLVLGCLFAILAPIPVLFFEMHVEYKLVIIEETGAYMAVGTNDLFVTITACVVFTYNATSALVSFILEVITFIVYCRLSRAVQLKRRDDCKLLVFAMTQMVGQIIAAFCASTMVVKTLFGFPYFFAIVPYLFNCTVDILGLSGPVCLLITSESVRTSYFRMVGALRKRRPAVQELSSVSVHFTL